MKAKLSATVEEPLLEFLDSLPGETRSAKLERLLAKYKQIEEEKALRKQLGRYREEDEERIEQEIWERTMAETMWNA
jgi:hypothetical protein